MRENGFDTGCAECYYFRSLENYGKRRNERTQQTKQAPSECQWHKGK